MARKKKRARKKKSRLTYIDKLDRLRTTYTPKTRARTEGGLDRYAKAWITRKWANRSLRAKATRLYAEGWRRLPPKEHTFFDVSFRKIPAPKRRVKKPVKPPPIETRTVRDTLFASMLEQKLKRQVAYVMRKTREGKIIRVLRRVKKSPDYKQGIASSKWINFENRTAEQVEAKLIELGDIAFVASAFRADLGQGITFED